MRGRISALIELGAGFHPEISGRENVAINGIMLGLTRRQVQERFDDIVAFAELERFIDAPVKTYSSGMYARLGFAVAIHVDPDVLLIDEVLAVGDESFTRKCLDKIGEFRRRGKTIVLVTHSLGLVEKMCDDVLWLRQGTKADQGDPKRVVDAYLTYVAGGEEALLSQEHGKAPVEAPADAPEAPGEEPAHGYREGRWGGREVEITQVRLLDDRDRPRHVYTPGERLTVALDVRAAKPVEDFVFGIGLFTADGVSVYGTNTHLEEFEAGRLDGSGEVRLSHRGPAPGRGHLPPRRGRAPPRRHAVRLPPRALLVPGEEPHQGRRRLSPRPSLDLRGRCPAHAAGFRGPRSTCTTTSRRPGPRYPREVGARTRPACSSPWTTSFDSAPAGATRAAAWPSPTAASTCCTPGT